MCWPRSSTRVPASGLSTIPGPTLTTAPVRGGVALRNGIPAANTLRYLFLVWVNQSIVCHVNECGDEPTRAHRHFFMQPTKLNKRNAKKARSVHAVIVRFKFQEISLVALISRYVKYRPTRLTKNTTVTETAIRPSTSNKLLLTVVK